MRAVALILMLVGAAFVSASVAPASAWALDYALPGPHAVGYSDLTVSVPERPSIGARMFYPATAPGGRDAPFDRSAAPYPAIAFGHGWLQSVSSYQSLLSHWASWGFVVIAPTSQGGLFPDHSTFAEDLRASLTWLTKTYGSTPKRRGRLVAAASLGVSGHSMGGGAAVLAASRDTRVTALTTMAAAETNPSAIAAMGVVAAPVQFLAGSSDTIAPPSRHQIPMYDAGRAPRQLVMLNGGTHTGFQDSSAGWQLEYTKRISTMWWRLYLWGDTELWPAVWQPEADPLVTLTADPGPAPLP
jgi:predicted dienelactone hydrolase